MKRCLDVWLSALGITILFPGFIIVALLVSLESRGGIFYRQSRIGFRGQAFSLLKFRTMYTGSDLQSRITVGNQDKRITPTGRMIRKYKLDEFPQLINVLHGTMSLVGPRPEVEEYVQLYTPDQLEVLSVKPGITDYASIAYMDENELLKDSNRPQKVYEDEIMPEKLKLNLQYINERSLLVDLKIIYKTVFGIAGKRP